MKKQPTPTTLFGPGRAFVAGLPAGFSLGSALQNARRVSLATAFSHNSGWSLLRHHLEHAKGDLRLITGLDFCQSEPLVLQAWLKLVTDRAHTAAYLAQYHRDPPCRTS